MGCPRLLSCGEPDFHYLGMVTVAPPGLSFVIPWKEADLVCLRGLHRRLPWGVGECLLPASGATAGAALQFHGQLYFGAAVQKKLRYFDLWGMPLENAMLKGADVRIIITQKRLNILPS